MRRVDIPAKLTGQLTYVHDMRLPGMLHGRVVRPPYTGADVSAPLGSGLLAVDESSVAGLPGLVKVVVIGDFVGVVCEREEQAIRAARQLKVRWKDWQGLPPLEPDRLEDTLRRHQKKPRTLHDSPGLEQHLAGIARPLSATYVWPYQLHASIGPSCALAEVDAQRARVWSGTQNPHDLRNDLARLLQRETGDIEVIRMEAAGCYGRNGADDVSADAVLLAQAVGRPVRVQLMREQEHGWEPKGTAQLIEVRGGLDEQGRVAAYDFATCYPPTARRPWPCSSPGGSRPPRRWPTWATAPRSRNTATRGCGWWPTTPPPSSARPGCAASRRCRTCSPMSPTSTNWRTWPASTPSPSAAATWTTSAPWR